MKSEDPLPPHNGQTPQLAMILNGSWQAQTHSILPQQLWHGFSASWESSIWKRNLHYPITQYYRPRGSQNSNTWAQRGQQKFLGPSEPSISKCIIILANDLALSNIFGWKMQLISFQIWLSSSSFALPQWQLEWNPAVAVEDRGLRAVVQPNKQPNNYHWCWNAIS